MQLWRLAVGYAPIRVVRLQRVNLLAPELFFLILAHLKYKM